MSRSLPSAIGPMARKSVLVTDYEQEFNPKLTFTLPSTVGSVVGVPLQTTSGAVLGVLTVGRVSGRPPHTEIDQDQLAGFGANAGNALELEEARSEHEHQRSAQEHERIAADLHDHVIQELFTVGMAPQGIARRLTKTDLKERVNGYVTTLDATVKRIRDTIYQLQTDTEPERTLPQRLADVVDEETAVAGLGVDTEFDGRLVDLHTPADR